MEARAAWPRAGGGIDNTGHEGGREGARIRCEGGQGRVMEVDARSGVAEVLAEAGTEELDVVRSLAKVRFHHSGRNAEDTKAAVRSKRERVPDVELCMSCKPECKTARVEVKDDIEDPFMW